MPDTREEDVLKEYIFSASQCPQGICLTDEFVLITSYSTEDDCMGELMVFDRETGEYMVTLGMDENSHLGGIAFDGDNVWVCNSYENCVERISYDFIELMAYQNTGDVVDARDVVEEFPVKNTPSCITWYGGALPTEETSLPIYIVTTLSRHSQPGRNIRERKWKCLRHRKNSM